jgi:hypothetical protein
VDLDYNIEMMKKIWEQCVTRAKPGRGELKSHRGAGAGAELSLSLKIEVHELNEQHQQ